MGLGPPERLLGIVESCPHGFDAVDHDSDNAADNTSTSTSTSLHHRVHARTTGDRRPSSRKGGEMKEDGRVLVRHDQYASRRGMVALAPCSCGGESSEGRGCPQGLCLEGNGSRAMARGGQTGETSERESAGARETRDKTQETTETREQGPRQERHDRSGKLNRTIQDHSADCQSGTADRRTGTMVFPAQGEPLRGGMIFASSISVVIFSQIQGVQVAPS
ncbi:hypothetical protein BJ875DRAFT_438506 [Amylocarpus encephaloides]|uniref:Uncharacterized protein n=1 Tax=Amylocarpus encephaloides TaxID=45428 RepID=A0A9P8C9P6_9HELO|nr:hypothetical protein BJ875DRAFT_438506 [Amylocarpus encephaloides]